jgi:hypothetical protein
VYHEAPNRAAERRDAAPAVSTGLGVCELAAPEVKYGSTAADDSYRIFGNRNQAP